MSRHWLASRIGARHVALGFFSRRALAITPPCSGCSRLSSPPKGRAEGRSRLVQVRLTESVSTLGARGFMSRSTRLIITSAPSSFGSGEGLRCRYQ